MNLYVLVHQEGGDVLLVSVGTDVLAFESRIDAEDFSDLLDEPGEFTAIPYEPDMGPALVLS